MIRRSFVCSSIKKEIKDHLYTTPIDSHLFGSQLGDVLKAAKAIHKTSAEMKTGAPIPGPPRRFTNQPQNLNTRRLVPSHGRQTGAAARHSTMPAQNGRQNYQRQQRRASYVSSKNNEIADAESRAAHPDIWELSNNAFNNIVKTFDEAMGIAVLPYWPIQPWFPLFESLLVSMIILFEPSDEALLTSSHRPPPLRLTLAAGRLSGRYY
ncbi:hypothetical protein HW555_013920 [Spodoptera exigua]|uniref:Uncharacterized protein n=1 Tax=Spodoptera exigua TaxID=7107 RepID=A0A835G0L2_SPOEX|nr:hypothetical protein HW555_013920 [Spodoptera exigua]